MQFWTVLGLLVLMFIALPLPVAVNAQVGGSLPVATTVVVSGDATPGAVVRYNPTTNTYSLTEGVDDALVYGVVAEFPALVFVTDVDAVPVVAEGGALVQVSSAVVVVRGDVLTASAVRGVATLAAPDSVHPFAVVREIYATPAAGGVYEVWADIGTAYARQVLAEGQSENQGLEATENKGRTWSVSWWRATVSALVAVAALVFMLLCVRSVATKALTAVGRNPRARATVFALAGLSIVAVVVVGIAVLFVAVGILVLPVL